MDYVQGRFEISGRGSLQLQKVRSAGRFFVEICNQILPFRSSVKSLDIRCHGLEAHSASSQGIQQDEIDPTLWTQRFHSFSSVLSRDIPATLEYLRCKGAQENLPPKYSSHYIAFPLLGISQTKLRSKAYNNSSQPASEAAAW
jgi:hypothetical protein